jgi:2-polyprenyl-3-methyl-5-hydroxy-6-metoxy-1,4-benzoquinol methylase
MAGDTRSLDRTREAQYQALLDIKAEEGVTRLGLMTNQSWRDDPRHLLFVLARYKFVAKMLTGRQRVLEVGCADAFGTRLVQQEVGALTAVDFDPVFVRDAQERMDPRWPFTVRVHDMLDGPIDERFDAVYTMDVIEHIPAEHEAKFIDHLAGSLSETGVLIVGTPSLQSQAYASPQSRAGHVNCKDAAQLRDLLSRVFHNVFVFSMNDEVVHTGYAPMAHYLLALCCMKHPAG